MVESTELRLGNYLQDRSGRLCRVERIDNNKEDVYAQGFRAPAIKGGMTSIPNSPIPLTEEWLLKLGFQDTAAWPDVYVKDGVAVIMELGKPKYFGSPSTLPLNYVHQLQNFYFAINGKELLCQ